MFSLVTFQHKHRYKPNFNLSEQSLAFGTIFLPYQRHFYYVPVPIRAGLAVPDWDRAELHAAASGAGSPHSQEVTVPAPLPGAVAGVATTGASLPRSFACRSARADHASTAPRPRAASRRLAPGPREILPR